VVLRKPSYRLAVLAFSVTLIVVMLGSFTRLKEAGLGCPDWPTCYGHFWVPNSAEEIHVANQAFADTPVETDKTWPEQVHRIFASSLGLLTIGLLWMAIRHRRNPAQPLKLPVFMLAFVILQGMFGMWTVTLLLWPQVVTAHLLGGFTVLSLFWLMVQRLGSFRWQPTSQYLEKLAALRMLAVTGLLVVVFQIFLGGWTSANYAALACPDFPTCHGVWLPHMDVKQGFNIFQHIGPNYLGGQLESDARTAIHYFHRLGAIVVTLVLLLLVARLWLTGYALARRMGVVITGVLLLQVGLGVSNILFALPLSVAVAHNAGGALLLLTLVSLNHRLFTMELGR
jgi:cytochrome c oxidase assembly protein subunit 15